MLIFKKIRHLAATVITMALLSLPLHALAAETADAEDEQGHWTVGAGVGVYSLLVSMRVLVRYDLEDIGLELRGGVLAPSFAEKEFLWDGMAGIRFKVGESGNMRFNVTPRAGMWRMDGGDRANVFTTTGGADFHWGSFVLSTELGGGVAFGPRFNTDAGAIPLLEIAVAGGWRF